MYYELFNEIFEDNENKICILEIGAFYVVLESQAVYLNELLGLKKVCFAPGICKVGFPKNSLGKYMKKLQELGVSFVVLESCNIGSVADYTYKLKGFKKRYEFVDERFTFNKLSYICNCNKCSFKKTEIMKELDNCRRSVSSLSSKISNLALIQDETVPCNFKADKTVYEELLPCFW